jgi:hypothetical protein
MRIATAATVWLAVLWAGCGDDDGGADAADDADVADADDADGEAGIEEPAPPVAPAVPAPPALTPCPAGWREVPGSDAEEPATCDPWPATGRAACADDEAHFPGEPGCRRIGTACPADGWPEGLPATGVRYVRAGAPAGGTGTRAAPFAAVSEALAGASAGTVVAVAAGTYDEAIAVPDGVTVQGACVSGTRLTRSAVATEEEATVTAGGSGALANLSVGGEGQGILADGEGMELDLRDVLVTGTVKRGVLAIDGGLLSGEAVVIRDVRPRTADGLFGRGAQAHAGGTLHLERSVVERCRDAGVIVFDGGTRAELRDVAVVDILPRAVGGSFGRGIDANDAAAVVLERVVVEGAHEGGVMQLGAGGSVRMTDVVVRDTSAPPALSAQSHGVAVQAGEMILRRVLVEANDGTGVFASAAGRLDAEDVVVRDTRIDPSLEQSGVGLWLQEGSEGSLVRAFFARCRVIAIVASNAVLTLRDVRVRDTLSDEATRTYGRGLEVEQGARADVERIVLERNRECGLLVADPRSRLDLRDAVVRDTDEEEGTRDFGRGIMVQESGHLAAARVRLERNEDIGVGILGATATLEDLEVIDTRSRAIDGWTGRGLEVGFGSEVTGARVRLAGNRDVGLIVGSPGTTLRLTDLEVTGTLERACVETDCSDAGNGFGIAVLLDAILDVDRFALCDSALGGLQIARGGQVDLHRGVVERNPIGVNLQVSGYDVSRLQDRVTYRDNERNLDATELPVPDVTVGTGP